jgi:hypothetical protein
LYTATQILGINTCPMRVPARYDFSDISNDLLNLSLSRATWLGEHLPIGHLVILSSFLKITEVAQIFRLIFSHGKSYVLILTKKWFGLHFGPFFHKLIWSPCLWLERTKPNIASFPC